MRISDVARATAVNIQTLRYYERRGLLPDPSRRPSGYREYKPETVQRVRFIKRAQELGFTLVEIGELLVLREDAGRRPDGRARAAATAVAKIEQIDDKLRQLTAMRAALAQLVTACECDRAAMECPIIEALEHAS
jgi:MerR family transcriptional regulator, mercuric resistance operon regulatory protein